MPYSLATLNPSLRFYLKQIALLFTLSFVLCFFVRFTHRPLLGPLDVKLFYLINNGIKNPFFDAIIPFFSLNWFIFVLAGIFFIYLLVNKGVKISVAFLIAFLLILPIGTLLKKTASLTRPYASLTNVHYYNTAGNWQLVKDYTAFSHTHPTSFPSGHALRFFILVGFFWKKRRIKYFLLIIGLLVMLNRVYTGVHYPSDTIVAAFISTYLGLLAQKLPTL